jgi:hypothetical protein
LNLNERQRQILGIWPSLLYKFLREEWRRAALGYASGLGLGALASFVREHTELLKPLLLKVTVDPTKTNGTVLSTKGLSDILHTPLFWSVSLPIALILFITFATNTRRIVNSWRHGISSGSWLLPFLIAFAFSIQPSPFSVVTAIKTATLTLMLLFLGFVLRLFGAFTRERLPVVDFSNPEKSTIVSYIVREASSPIESIDDDKLGRSAFVEMLATRVLVSKAPVLALRGNFGDGKSSTLRILRQQIAKKAIVVSFSTWLPDSQKTLVGDLLGDIATEISSQYFVPALRRRLEKFATLLSGNVASLKFLSGVISPYTQRAQIADLEELLSRIPRRVVVLLDEIDRMQKDELLTLLKVLRGSSSLPNITFVCAFHQEQIEKILGESSDYLDKFFPTSVDLPKPDPNILLRMLKAETIDRLTEVGWLVDASTTSRVKEEQEKLWSSGLSQTCTNIRRVELLANDVLAVASLVRDEVDPVDLCAIEAIRRFYPTVYEIIWKNSEFFSSSAAWWKSMKYKPKPEQEAQQQRIRTALENTMDSEIVKMLLGFMFPERMTVLGGAKPRQSDQAFEESEKRKGISHPDYFPIYFSHSVPDVIFSSREMTQIMAALRKASGDAERKLIVSAAFDSLEPGSVREFDFLAKLAREVEKEGLPVEVARSVAVGVAEHADKLSDDFIVSEVRRGLSVVFAVAQRLSETDAINMFLSECLAQASTDSFAARLYIYVTDRRGSNNVLKNFEKLDIKKLQKAFIERMTRRYGPDSDLSTLALTRFDITALYLWTGMGSNERDTEISFWQRYIGVSRRKLADAFDLIAPPDTFWTKDSPAFIERILPMEFLKRAYAETASTEPLVEDEERSLARLKLFIDGKLRDGQLLANPDESSSTGGL